MYPFKSNQMYEKHDETDNTQWPLNQSAYQNVANDQVDWAALAQQWIYMKETCTTDELLTAPPPPIISRQEDYEEQGEAPMEVEKDDEHPQNHSSNATNEFPQSSTNTSENWQAGWPNAPSAWRKSKEPGWNTWTNPNFVPPPQPQAIRAPLLPDPFGSNNTDNAFDVRSDKYWQHFASNANSSTEYMDKATRMEHNARSLDTVPSPLDAAKRKTLPSWIRQGLEKMEREKLKSAEKERERKEHADLLEQRKLAGQHGSNSFIDTTLTHSLKSKFDSESDTDNEDLKLGETMPSRNKSVSPPRIVQPKKSKQDQLQELMLLVRSSLTEILLEVTNEEIRTIATETLSKNRLKARTAQTIKKSALTSLTGGLGLGIYADSDNSNESGTDDDDVSNDNDSDGNDSYSELQEIVKRRKTSFEVKAKEIESIIAAEEVKEKSWLEAEQVAKTSIEVRESSNVESDIGEVQQEKIYLSHGRSNERKTTRFSDPSDTVKNIHVTHGSIIYETVVNAATLVIPKNGSSSTSGSRNTSTMSYHDRKDSDSSSSSSTSKTKSKKYKKMKPDTTSSEDSDDAYYRRKHAHKSRNRDRSSKSSSIDKNYLAYENKSSSSRRPYYDESRENSKYKSRHYSDSRESSQRSYDYVKNSSSRQKRSRSRSRENKNSHPRY